jgi:2-oxoglutarate dehydrogenase E2 component (dihydrolipoamide succinyltransferase)
MGTNIVVPNMGESIVEATVARWFVQPGDQVELGQVLVELETEKVNLEVGAEQGGVLARINKEAGEDVRVGEVLGEIDEADQESPTKSSRDDSHPKEAEPGLVTEQPTNQLLGENQEDEQANGWEPIVEKVTPVARRVAEKHGVDLANIQGTGAGGKVLRQDVEKQIEGVNQYPIAKR